MTNMKGGQMISAQVEIPRRTSVVASSPKVIIASTVLNRSTVLNWNMELCASADRSPLFSGIGKWLFLVLHWSLIIIFAIICILFHISFHKEDPGDTKQCFSGNSA